MFSIVHFSVMNSGYTAVVFEGPIDGVIRGLAFSLCRLKGFSVRKVAEICNISRGSVCKIVKEKLWKRSILKTMFKGGPARFKLSERQQRLLIRVIKVLRNRDRNFTCKRPGFCRKQESSKNKSLKEPCIVISMHMATLPAK